jgi:hypothetical protein
MWTCDKNVAELQLDSFQATLDAARPGIGLVLCGPWGSQAIHAQLLGLAIALHRPGEVNWPGECYVRGDDLVVAYQESALRPLRPLRVDAVWRALRPGPADRFLAAVELIVSVRTELPNSPAIAFAQSELPGGAMFRLLGTSPPHCDALALAPSDLLRLVPADGPGCVLCRLPEVELSYAEMVHPADFQSDEVSLSPLGAVARLCHRLFPQSLEKGVILRSRVRGVFLPRENDVALAAACYAAFAAAEPPLDAF